MILEGNVLITGGSGFLGRAILRRAEQEDWPARFIVYSRDETKQWELKRRYPGVNCLLGDVARDLDRLTAAMIGCDIVIHAGAVKYIPEAEFNVSETIDVNIIGSRNVAIAARVAGVKTVVGISTDKACSPTNTYGATKMLMERYFAEANRMGGTKFITVRYGNVVGSTGSVIPVFKKQILDYGEIRITDPRMTRFWLGVDQAVSLVLYAVSKAQECPGWTIIDPCPAMTILDLAKAVAGSINAEVPLQYTGIRPGEKIHENLWSEQEAPRIEALGTYYGLRPATSTMSLGESSAYSSGQPLRWLSIEEMIGLIKDAESV